MKNQLLTLILTIFWVTGGIFAQADAAGEFLRQNTIEKPFAKIDNYLAKNNQDFDNGEEIVKLFNQERIRLGANFETELWKYLGQDFRKYYWINSFVETESYLGGNQPLPDLAIRIRAKAQDLPVKSDDYEFLGMKFTILRRYSVDLFLDKKLDLAKLVKQKAERIYKEIEALGVVGSEESDIVCIYENLENNAIGCQRENTKVSNQATQLKNNIGSDILSGGILNGRAISLPAPEYPKAGKAVGAAGAVNVQVTVDEEGNVISANALSGHTLLQSAAVDAAKQAKFQPMSVKGKLRKFTGIIVYNFSK